MSYLFSRVTLANEISEYRGSKKVISSLFTDSKKVANDTIDIKGIFTESISKDCNALLKSKMSWNYQNIEYVVNAMLECKGTIFTTGIGKTNGTSSFHKFKRPGKFLSESIFSSKNDYLVDSDNKLFEHLLIFVFI